MNMTDIAALRLEIAKACDNWTPEIKIHPKLLEKILDQLEATQKELSVANERLNKPVVLDKYWIEPAIHWNEEEEVMPVDEIIKAIKASGFTVEGE